MWRCGGGRIEASNVGIIVGWFPDKDLVVGTDYGIVWQLARTLSRKG